jgi:hypothetical protein
MSTTKSLQNHDAIYPVDENLWRNLHGLPCFTREIDGMDFWALETDIMHNVQVVFLFSEIYPIHNLIKMENAIIRSETRREFMRDLFVANLEAYLNNDYSFFETVSIPTLIQRMSKISDPIKKIVRILQGHFPTKKMDLTIQDNLKVIRDLNRIVNGVRIIRLKYDDCQYVFIVPTMDSSNQDKKLGFVEMKNIAKKEVKGINQRSSSAHEIITQRHFYEARKLSMLVLLSQHAQSVKLAPDVELRRPTQLGKPPKVHRLT